MSHYWEDNSRTPVQSTWCLRHDQGLGMPGGAWVEVDSPGRAGYEGKISDAEGSIMGH